ncbi:dTDP-6-deoxy-L-talose 4-dehydrogenase (NAD+) [Spirosoma lacussanchae]|uniref:NAD-dependent epimerase/dehydratase family protein n=1 Tax=Spirosoma lacussanchae TaxID=1884249 RepID=UPI0011089959|nr:NAD-dependent epimerase/dehydratase family protein [Spirosoma lacussanchae]
MNNVKTVLVTGATGFVGRHVLDHLLTIDGIRVVATARAEPDLTQSPWLRSVPYIPFDMATDPSDTDLFDRLGRPDAVIHLAWPGLPDYRSPRHVDTYWLQQYRFLTNLISHGLTNLTVTGTCLEYGLQSGSLAEDLPTQPTTAYGLGKDTLRKALDQFLTGRAVSFKWLRLFYMYGAGQNPRSLLSQLETAALRGDSVFNMSGGEQLRDYLPVTDVARYIVKAALQTRVTGPINCCSGQPVAVRTFVERFMQERGYMLTLNLGHYPYPDYEPMAFWGTNQKLLTL